MTSSREDLNALLNGAIDVATDLLASHTEFVPFALAMQSVDGEIFHVEPEEEEGDASVPDDHVVTALRRGLSEAAEGGRWRAVAICADVTLEGEDGGAVTSAIHVMLEHLNEDPVTCTVPYAIGEEAVELEDLVAEPGDKHVFGETPLPN